MKNIPEKSERVSISKDWWENKTHILIDMDGTLIGQPGAMFQNLLVMGLFMKFNQIASLRDIFRATLKAKDILFSEHTFENNREAFLETVAHELNSKKTQVEKFLKKFFDSEYPFICLFLHREPYARRLLDLLHFTNRHVTLATNPIFGRKEIELRLKSSDLYLHDFDLVTSWEVMKSTKPNFDFFSETLTKIGAKPENTVMIGNDPYYDLPAHRMGISTLLVGDHLKIKDIVESLEESLENDV
jgi:FMN phosphatase YigB (HAD superfamily)